MFDKPHKTGPEDLQELDELSAETRQHVLGLFERWNEGRIILALQVVFVFSLILVFPKPVHKLIDGWKGLLWLLYFSFSVFWTTRSVSPIHSRIMSSLTKEELSEGDAYGRYCMGGWFLRTIGGLLLVTALLIGMLYALS